MSGERGRSSAHCIIILAMMSATSAYAQNSDAIVLPDIHWSLSGQSTVHRQPAMASAEQTDVSVAKNDALGPAHKPAAKLAPHTPSKSTGRPAARSARPRAVAHRAPHAVAATAASTALPAAARRRGSELTNRATVPSPAPRENERVYAYPFLQPMQPAPSDLPLRVIIGVALLVVVLLGLAASWWVYIGSRLWRDWLRRKQPERRIIDISVTDDRLIG